MNLLIFELIEWMFSIFNQLKQYNEYKWNDWFSIHSIVTNEINRMNLKKNWMNIGEMIDF